MFEYVHDTGEGGREGKRGEKGEVQCRFPRPSTMTRYREGGEEVQCSAEAVFLHICPSSFKCSLHRYDS